MGSGGLPGPGLGVSEETPNLGVGPAKPSADTKASFSPSQQPRESGRRRLQPSVLCIYAKRPPGPGDASHLLRPLFSDL